MAFAPQTSGQWRQRKHVSHASKVHENPTDKKQLARRQALRQEFEDLVGQVGLPWMDAIFLERCVVMKATAAEAAAKPTILKNELEITRGETSLSRIGTPSLGNTMRTAAGGGPRGVRSVQRSRTATPGSPTNSRSPATTSPRYHNPTGQESLLGDTPAPFAPSAEHLERLVKMMKQARNMQAEALKLAKRREALLEVIRSEMYLVATREEQEQHSRAFNFSTRKRSDSEVGSDIGSPFAPSGPFGAPASDDDADGGYLIASLRRIVSSLKEHDECTDNVVTLISEWRENLQRPQPLMVDGYNYMLKIHNDIGTILTQAHLFVLAKADAKGSLQTLKVNAPELYYISHYMSSTVGSQDEARDFRQIAYQTTTKTRSQRCVEAVASEGALQESYVSEMLLRCQQGRYPLTLRNTYSSFPQDDISGSYLRPPTPAPAAEVQEDDDDYNPLTSGNNTVATSFAQVLVSRPSMRGMPGTRRPSVAAPAQTSANPYLLGDNASNGVSANSSDGQSSRAPPTASEVANSSVNANSVEVDRHGFDYSVEKKNSPTRRRELIFPLPLVATVSVSVLKEMDGEGESETPLAGAMSRQRMAGSLRAGQSQRPSKFVDLVIVDSDGMLTYRGMLYLFAAEAKLSLARTKSPRQYVEYTLGWLFNCFKHARQVLEDQESYVNTALSKRGMCPLVEPERDALGRRRDGRRMTLAGTAASIRGDQQNADLDRLVDIFDAENGGSLAQMVDDEMLQSTVSHDSSGAPKGSAKVRQLLRATVGRLARDSYRRLLRRCFFNFERKQKAAELERQNLLRLMFMRFRFWTFFHEGRKMAKQLTDKLHALTIRRHRNKILLRWKTFMLERKVTRAMNRKVYLHHFQQLLIPVAVKRAKAYGEHAAAVGTLCGGTIVDDEKDRAALKLQGAIRCAQAQREVALLRRGVKPSSRTGKTFSTAADRRPLLGIYATLLCGSNYRQVASLQAIFSEFGRLAPLLKRDADRQAQNKPPQESPDAN